MAADTKGTEVSTNYVAGHQVTSVDFVDRNATWFGAGKMREFDSAANLSL